MVPFSIISPRRQQLWGLSWSCDVDVRCSTAICRRLLDFNVHLALLEAHSTTDARDAPRLRPFDHQRVSPSARLCVAAFTFRGFGVQALFPTLSQHASPHCHDPQAWRWQRGRGARAARDSRSFRETEDDGSGRDGCDRQAASPAGGTACQSRAAPCRSHRSHAARAAGG